MTGVSFRQQTASAAEAYERYFVPAIAAPVAGDLLRAAALRPGERVADVACGTGIVARLAAEQVGPAGSVVGIDISPDMVEIARRSAEASGGAVTWHVADAAELPLEDSSCDAVLCQMGLMFMADRPGALAEMRRVLAPGGRLALNTPGPIQAPFEILEAAIADHIDPALGGFVRAVFSMHDPEVLRGLVADAGFADVDVSQTTATLDLPGPAEFLWQYINLTPLRDVVHQAPEEAKEAMEAQVVRGWEPFVVDGRVQGEQPMVMVSARR